MGTGAEGRRHTADPSERFAVVEMCEVAATVDGRVEAGGGPQSTKAHLHLLPRGLRH